MKTRVLRSSVALLVCFSAFLALAGDYHSVILAANGSQDINVPNDHFLKIRNFTQEGGTTRGVVSVTIGGQTANVMVASIVNTATTPASEAINSIIVAGPARVTATCPSDATSCFISYRKDDD